MEILIFVAALAIMAVVLISAVKCGRRRKEEEIRLLRDHGFEPADQLEPGLAEQLVEQTPPGRHTRRYRDIYCRRRPDEQIYLFTVRSTGDSDSSGQKMAALVMPDVKLPRFSLHPRVILPGILGRLLNRLVTQLASRGMTLVTPDNEPGFEKKYLLYAQDAEAVKALFHGNMVRRLLERNHLFQIHAAGNSLIFSAVDFKNYQTLSRLDRERLQQILEDARMLGRTLREQMAVVSDKAATK